MKQPQIIAHRGASYLAPENTLAAFRIAQELGSDGIEFDVQQTKDGQLVIHHDYFIDFHTQLSGNIYDMLEGDLRTLDFGGWKNVIFRGETIPTLAEALAVGSASDTMLVELKSSVNQDEHYVPRVLECIEASGCADKVTLLAFQHDLLRQARALWPELKVGALLYGSLGGYLTPPQRLQEQLDAAAGASEEENGLSSSAAEERRELIEALGGPQGVSLALDMAEHPEDYGEENSDLTRWVNGQLTVLRANFPGQSMMSILFNVVAQGDPASYVRGLPFQPDLVSCEYHTAFARPTVVEELRALGMRTAFWTPDTRASIQTLARLEPDMLVTNRPDTARTWLQEAEQ